MKHVVMLAVMVVASLPFFSACTSEPCNGATPCVTPGPAFFVHAFHRVRCPEGPPATACFRVRVENAGEMAGDGMCRLIGTNSGSNGDTSVESEQLPLHDVPADGVVTPAMRWTTTIPDHGIRAVCEPGPRT